MRLKLEQCIQAFFSQLEAKQLHPGLTVTEEEKIRLIPHTKSKAPKSIGSYWRYKSETPWRYHLFVCFFAAALCSVNQLKEGGRYRSHRAVCVCVCVCVFMVMKEHVIQCNSGSLMSFWTTMELYGKENKMCQALDKQCHAPLAYVCSAQHQSSEILPSYPRAARDSLSFSCETWSKNILKNLQDWCFSVVLYHSEVKWSKMLVLSFSENCVKFEQFIHIMLTFLQYFTRARLMWEFWGRYRY